MYQLKELILREWKSEWGPKQMGEAEEEERGRPSSPGAIRLIFFGRLLEDGVAVGGKLYPFLIVEMG